MTVPVAPAILVMDLGGVTCRWVPDRRLHALSDLCGLPPDTIDQLVFGSGFDDAGERGQFTLREFTVHLAAILGVGDGADEATAVALRRAWATAFEPHPAVLRSIGRVAGATALLTNNGPLLEEALSHELSEVGTAFDHLLFSWRLGAPKPNLGAFEAAAAALDVDPGQLLLVDDSEANVDAARAAGWRAHRFETVLGLDAALAAAGLR